MTINIKNLTINYNNNGSTKEIISNVGFSVGQAQTAALIGPSGSGKTMTALAIMGLLPTGFMASGEIEFEKQDLLRLSESQMRLIRGSSIAYTLQNAGSLNPSLKIRSQIIEKKYGINTAGAERLLRQVGLDRKFLNYYPHQLSGGMRQRVLLAIALAAKPKLLIADEPTSGLDATIAAQIIALLKDIQRQNNMSLLLITHDLAIVDSIADKVVHLRQDK